MPYDDRAKSGGAMLRDLRLRSGLTLLDLAGRLDDADLRIDTAHLHRIESGRIARPAATTIESILQAGYDAPYLVRRDVLDAYGYRLPWELPTASEIADMQRLLANELDTATWPVYFMDYSLRIWGWNRYFPRLLGTGPDDPRNAAFMGVTHIDIVLNPALGTTGQIHNAHEFAPLMLTMFRLLAQPYQHQQWYTDFVDRAHTWPGFPELWAALPDDDHLSPLQQVLPVEISVPGVDPVMRFRITTITFSLDPRFQIVHLIPFGAATLRECATWAEAAGEP